MKFRKLIKYCIMAFIMVLMVDSMPPKGIGDDTVLFLNPSTNAPPPDVAILLDTSGSMTSLPCAVPDGEDACGVNSNNKNPYFVNTLGYVPTEDYGYSGTNRTCFDNNINPGGEGCFYGGTAAGSSTEGPLVANKIPSGTHVYLNGYFDGWGQPSYCRSMTAKGPGGIVPTYWWDCGTVYYFCAKRGGTATQQAVCRSQLLSYGYWWRGYSSWTGGGQSFYTGNFLNFYPPKFTVTRKVISDLIDYNATQYASGRGVRIGIFSFDSSGAETDVQISPPCSQLGTPPTRNNYLNAIYSITWDHSTPLAGAAIQVGSYFANNKTNATWYDNLACNGDSYCSSDAPNAGSAGGSADSWCGTGNSASNSGGPFPCEKNFLIVMTDGNENNGPNGLENWPITNYKKSTVFESACSGNNVSSCNIDEVAGFLNANSIRPPNEAACTTNVDTYTIGFAGTSADGQKLNTFALQRAAQLGQGLFAPATNPQSLEDALYTFFANILQKNRTYGTPNLPQIVTTGSANTSTTIPIFKSFIASFLPKDQNFWVGHLREYTGIAFTQTGTIQLFDKNGNPFTGNTSTQGQCSFSEYVPPPIWDAGADLSMTTLTPCNFTLGGNTGYCYLAPSQRMIYTVTPALLSGFTSHTTGNGDTYWSAGTGGKQLTLAQQFTTTNANLQASDFSAPDTATMDNIINYIIGPKQDGISVLGDIFHSDPTFVSTDALEQIDKYDDPTLIPTGSLGYKGYLTATYNMPQIVVAGANDGMIHAFYAGGYEPGSASFDGNGNYIPGTAQYDYGTGQEVWAFVPYDLLPKLQYLYNPALVPTTTTGQYWTTEGIYTTTSTSHVYYVDSSPYVRDVYMHGIDNGLGLSGNAAYWHTIMIIGERLGGTYYICLDITNRLQPTFMWEFTTNNMGFTFDETQPQPPPMGPVYLNFNPSTGAAFTMPTPVWVALLSGGWDPMNGTTGNTLTTNRGRAFYVVDIASGKLVWKYDRSIDATMAYPTPASPVYIGPPNSTARWWIESFMPDLGGQLWQFSFMPQNDGAGSWGADLDPGTGLVRRCIAPPPADSNCWWGNRTFAVQDPAPAQLQAQQFYYMPSASWDQCSVPNLWLGLAAGDRDNPLNCTPTDYLYEIMAPQTFANKFFTSSKLQLSNPATGVSTLPVCATTFSPTGWYTSLSGFTGTANGSKALSIPNAGGDIQYLSIFTPDQNACIIGTRGGFSCNALGGTGVVAGFVMYPIMGTGQNPGKLISFASTGSGIPSAPMAVTSIFGSSGQSTTSTTITPPNPFSIPTCGGGAGTSSVNTQMIVATSESGILNLGTISSYNMLLYPYYQICIPQNVEQGLVNPQNLWSPHRNYQ